MKGARETGDAASMANALVASLQPLGEIRSRKMFGGYDIFAEDTMFAIVDSAGTAFLRADDTTAGAFEATGSDRHGRMPYWQIPPAVLETDAELIVWATRALEAALDAKK